MRFSGPYRKPSEGHPVLWTIIGLAIAVRLMLPELIRHAANERLAQIPDYKGHVDRVHLALWRGAVEFRHLTLEHVSGELRLTIDEVGMQLRWLPLLQRHVLLRLWVESPDVLILTRKPQETAQTLAPPSNAQKEEGYSALPDTLAGLIPFRIEEFALSGGRMTVRPLPSSVPAPENQTLPPHSELTVRDIAIDVGNVTNSKEISGSLTAQGSASATLMSDGKMNMHLNVDPLARTPKFGMDFTVRKFDLADLNPLLNWQWDLAVKQGTFELFAGAKAADGEFAGYVKPLIENFEAENPEGKKGLLQRLKKDVINVMAKVLKNAESDRVATKIPFEGRFTNPHAGLWEAILNVLRNAFIAAIQPSLDKSIHLQ